jgi:hypothetical protein
MNEYHVVMTDELGEEFSVEYPESSIVYIMPKGF